MKLKKLDEAVISKIRSCFSVNTVSQCTFELVCNSLDAKSTSIAVRINLSNFRIQVADNGDGISKENMEVIGTRYMTNKCHNLKELARHINFYGFRGEALSSIIDVSESITVSARQKHAPETYSVTLSGSSKGTVKPAKLRPSCGTTVTVYGFLSKLPVRSKRIVPELELEEIKRNLEHLIIINPGTSFTLRNDVTGMLLLNSPKTTDIIGSFRYLHPEIDESFMLLKVTKSKVSVDCLVHKEFVISKKFQFTYVNKRPVLSPKLQKCISNAFMKRYQNENKPKREIILNETKKYPIFVVNVKCPHSFVDILQDPFKSQIEFKDWNLVFSCISKLVESYFGDDEEEPKVPKILSKVEDKIIRRGASQVYGAVGACAYKNKPEYNKINEKDSKLQEDIIESEDFNSQPSDQEMKQIDSDTTKINTREKPSKIKHEKINKIKDDFDIDRILQDLNHEQRENRVGKEGTPRKPVKEKRRHRSPSSNFNFNKFLDELKNDANPYSKEKYSENPLRRFAQNKTTKGPTQNTLGNYEIQDSGEAEPVKPRKLRSIMKKPLQISTENQIRNKSNGNENLEDLEHNEIKFNTEAEQTNLKHNEVKLNKETEQKNEIALPENMTDKSIFSTFTNDESKGKNLIMDMFLKSTQIFTSESDDQHGENHMETSNKSTNNSSQETIVESNFLMQNNYQDTFKGINATMSVSMNVKRKRRKEKSTTGINDKTSKAVQTMIFDDNLLKETMLAENLQTTYKPELKRHKSNLSDLTRKFNNFDVKSKKCNKYADNYTILISGSVQTQPNFKFVPKEEPCDKTCSELDMFKPFKQNVCPFTHNYGQIFNFASKIQKTINVDPDKNKDEPKTDLFEGLLATVQRDRDIPFSPPKHYAKNVDRELLKPHQTELGILPGHKHNQNIDIFPNKESTIPVQDYHFKIPVFKKASIIKRQKPDFGVQKHAFVENSPYFVKKQVNQRILHVCESPYFVGKSNVQRRVHHRTINQQQEYFPQVDIPNTIQYYEGFQPKYQTTQFGQQLDNYKYIDSKIPYQHQNLPYQIQNNVCSPLNARQSKVYVPLSRYNPENYGNRYAQKNIRMTQGPIVFSENQQNFGLSKYKPDLRHFDQEPHFIKNVPQRNFQQIFTKNNSNQISFIQPHKNISPEKYFFENIGYQSRQELILNNKSARTDTKQHKPNIRTDSFRRLTNNASPCNLNNKEYNIISLRYPEEKLQKYTDISPENFYPNKDKQGPNFEDKLINQRTDDADKSNVKPKTISPGTESFDLGKIPPDNEHFSNSLTDLQPLDCSFKFSFAKSVEICSGTDNSLFGKDVKLRKKSPQSHNLKHCSEIPTVCRFNSKESFLPITLNQKEKPLSSALEISLPNKNEKQKMLARELEDPKLINEENQFLGTLSHVPTAAENQVVNNVLGSLGEVEQSIVIVDSHNIWLKRCTDNGEKFYINQRTGVVTKQYPKINYGQFNFDTRRDYVPKGMSPVLKGHKEVDKSLSQNAKKKLQEFILESYDNELLVVKWENYISDDPKEFFKEIYQEKCKLFETCIPSIYPESSKKFPESIFTFTKSMFFSIEVVGQVDKKFIAVIEKENKMLVLFDQHAVHERVRLEKLLQVYKGSKAPCKESFLLFVPQNDLSLLKKHTNYLSSLGLDIAFFPNGLRVENIPLCIQEKCSKENSQDLNTLLSALLKEVIELLKETRGSERPFPKIIQNLMNLKACRGALKFGDALSNDECSQLLKDLSLCNLPFQCAHGRPTLTPLLNLNKIMEKTTSRFNFKILQKVIK